LLIQNLRMSIFFSYNGRFYKQGTPVISVDNRSLKFGDGLFETMKIVSGKLELKEYHFERLFNGMKILGFDIPPDFTSIFFEKEITELAKKNTGHKNLRARLMVFRGDGSLNDPKDHYPNYIIQTWPLPDVITLNTRGLIIDICPGVKKSIDILSNLKTNNFLPYALAAIHTQKNNLNDCIVLNTNGRICDTTVANIFIIKDNIVYTPSLKEGCIAGVTRRWMIEEMERSGIKIKEKPVTVEDIKTADEIFLTNSIYPMRWVKQFENIKYNNKQIKILYNKLIGPNNLKS
jgi:branched-chain amino acid aminotransferase